MKDVRQNRTWTDKAKEELYTALSQSSEDECW